MGGVPTKNLQIVNATGEGEMIGAWFKDVKYLYDSSVPWQGFGVEYLKEDFRGKTYAGEVMTVRCDIDWCIWIECHHERKEAKFVHRPSHHAQTIPPGCYYKEECFFHYAYPDGVHIGLEPEHNWMGFGRKVFGHTRIVIPWVNVQEGIPSKENRVHAKRNPNGNGAYVAAKMRSVKKDVLRNEKVM